MRIEFLHHALLLAAVGLLVPPVAAQVEFNRDIRPILSDRCYTCHGPDESKRLSALRFDTESGAKADLGGRFAIVPRDTANSELIRRVTSDDPARRMPPAYGGHARLTDPEIELLTRWVEQGAEWQGHWSFVTPTRPTLPTVSDGAWPKNAIDHFILERLDRQGLKPSPAADRRTLMRRVSFDLTGLPPTLDEVNAFVADESPAAFENVVDRLLATPRYGEHMAMRWLDAARYADTNGYQTDAERSMWRWRDWVIDAFNQNLPYDRFTIEQIAGDLLPNPSRDQLIATGFNRNHRGNGEGGIIGAEYAVEYVVDRVETTSTVWMGLTLGCARCHNHKYDPFTQKEFYQLFAYFNQVPESGKAFKYGNSPPLITAPTVDQEGALAALDAKLAAAERRAETRESQAAGRQARWESSLAGSERINWAPPYEMAVEMPLDGSLAAATTPDPPLSSKYRYLMSNGPQDVVVPEGDPEWIAGDAAYGEGLVGQAAVFDGKRYVQAGDVANFGFFDAFTLSAWIYPTASSGAILSRAVDDEQGQGFTFSLNDGHLYASVIQRWLDDGIRIESEETVPLNQWSHVMLTTDGSRLAANTRFYLDGKELKTTAHLDYMNQPFAAKEPLRIGAGQGMRFEGRIAQVRLYRDAFTPEAAAVLASRESLNEIARLAPEERSDAQATKLRWAFLDSYAPGRLQASHKEVLDLRQERKRLVDSFPTVMVMQDDAEPHPTYRLNRGAYDQPGEEVTAAVPAALPALLDGSPNNRLGLAQWLVNPGNPLTARVAVNRYWQTYFGTGLVRTTEDFGSQGELPSHPALLDWLATEYVRSGWDTKAMQKTIVMSAAYQQSSRVTPELLEKDPDNRLLARGPRIRLAAEMVRDQSLAVSQLLVSSVGGPSVKPYQPAGLWSELGTGSDYAADQGDALYRRSLYTFWKRTSPPPMMTNFDAGTRESCVVRTSRTNTPLQSLNLMNDVAYLEASRKMAERMMKEGGAMPSDRLSFGLQLVTARPPSKEAGEILLSSLNYYRDLFSGDPDAALQYLSQGDSARDESLNPSELAAYATVASLMLNLDSAVTKE
jgi:hypothetical protein